MTEHAGANFARGGEGATARLMPRAGEAPGQLLDNYSEVRNIAYIELRGLRERL